MKKTLVLYETYYGITKKAAEAFAKIAGNVRLLNIKDAGADITNYDNIVTFFAFHGYETAKNTSEYLSRVQRQIKDKIIALIAVGISKRDLDNYTGKIEQAMGRKADYKEFVEGELRVNKLTEEDRKILIKFLGSLNMKLMDMGKFKLNEVCNLAYKYRDLLNSVDKKLADDKLKNEIINYINSHNTCALGSGYNEFIRVTPIEYIFYKDNIYFMTEGGHKFNGILQNPNVSIAIYDEYKGFNQLKGLQITGRAEVIEIGCTEYKEIMNLKGIKYENLPIDMNMIKVNPEKYEFLNSDFKKINVDAKQVLYVS